MNVLVAVASKHGSTREIAEAIAGELRSMGIDADLRGVGDVESIAGYDALILGSALYMGNWLADAKDFANRFAGCLGTRPVWVFSSGPRRATPLAWMTCWRRPARAGTSSSPARPIPTTSASASASSS